MRLLKQLDWLAVTTGVTLAVATTKTTAPESVEQAALLYFNRRGIGDRRRNNGLLIFVAVDDQKVRLEVGLGLEPEISNDRASTIVRAMTARFRAGDYFGGMLSATTLLHDLLAAGG